MPHAAILCQIYCTASPIFLPRGTARSKQPGRMECWPTWPDRELLFQRTWNPKIQKQMERSRGSPHDLTLHQTNSASLAFQLPHGPVGTTSGAHDEKIDVMKSGNTIQNKNRNFGIFRHHFQSSWNVIALPKVLSLWFIAYSILFAIDEQQNFPFLGWRTPHGNGLLEKLVEDSFAYLHNISISSPAFQRSCWIWGWFLISLTFWASWCIRTSWVAWRIQKAHSQPVNPDSNSQVLFHFKFLRTSEVAIQEIRAT